MVNFHGLKNKHLFLADGTTQVAVKRLGRMGPAEIGFLEEVETIGSVHHFNLARLIGFCAENKNRLLVYEYMSNGSLEKWIFKRDLNKDLNWATRKKIIHGVAKGLAYLHEDCRHKIIHLDVKPHNILLDESFNAKISDFGLSKLIARDQSQLLIGMLGTPGYVAPDSTVTVKSDVYSFGIVLLEIVARRKISDSSRSESIFVLPQMLEKKGGDGDDQDQLIDIVEDLDEDMENHREEVLRTIRIGVWCLQHDHTRRPLMSAVVQALQGLTEVDPDIIYKFSHPTASASKSNHQDHLISVAPQASILSGPR
ncbi:hypothetical protein EV1_030269 [Malus domestica]